MKKFIKTFKNQNEDRLNLKLIDREYEDDIAQSIIEVFKSFETIPNVQFLSYTIEDDESKINFSKYITSRRKKKKKDKNTKFIYIKEDRAFEITMRFRISVKDQVMIVKKSILVPLFDKDKYVTLKGKRYFLLYQLVDSSTYVSKNGLTMKSLMPIVIKFRDKHTILTDSEGNDHDFVTYYMKAFRREISVLIFFLCKMGFSKTLRYFLLDQIIEVVPTDSKEEKNESTWYYFSVNKNFGLRVRKYFFDKYDYIQAMTGMIIECITSKTTLINLEQTNYWLEQLGSLYTNTKHKKIESGASTMLFFERLLDVTTKKTLKISQVNKISIYAIVRWLISNFADLRKKNNMDLNTKRLRLNEYVGSMLNLKLGDSISRVMAYGSKASLKQIKTNLFKFPGTIVLQVLGSSELLKFDDRTNDLDFVSRLRYTVKGPKENWVVYLATNILASF